MYPYNPQQLPLQKSNWEKLVRHKKGTKYLERHII